LLEQVGRVPGLAQALGRLGFEEVPTPAQAASAVEFVLEGLHLTRRLAKDVLDDGRVVYGSNAAPDDDGDERRRRRRER
jgi:magnesium chelatase subunit I